MPIGLPRAQWRRAATAAIAAATAFACNSLTGLNDLTTVDDPAVVDAASVDAGVEDVVVSGDANSPVIEPPKACPSEGRRCVPVAPPGWLGPLVVQEAGLKGTKLGCPANMGLAKVEGHLGEPTGAVTCSACTCGAPNTTCGAMLMEYGTNGCADAPNPSTLSATCVARDTGQKAYKLLLDAGATSCPADGGGVATRSVSFPTSLLGCGAPELLADGCAAGEVCAPDPPTTFRPKHCIAKVGSDACPAPWTVKRDGFTGVTDNRQCSACSCQAPVGVTCSGTATQFAGTSSCLNPIIGTNVPLPIGCTITSLSVAWKIPEGGLTPAGGSCTPNVSAPLDGGLANKDPVTVCCEP